MVIIEGMDGSGKSTLFGRIAQSLQGDLRFKDVLMYLSGGIPQSEDEVLIRLRDESQRIPITQVISDRSEFMSQFVYGGLNSKERLIDLSSLKDSFSFHHTFFIYCDCTDNSNYLERWRANVGAKYFDGQLWQTQKQFDEIHQRYKDIITFGLRPKWIYNYEKSDTFALIDLVKRYLLGEMVRTIASGGRGQSSQNV